MGRPGYAPNAAQKRLAEEVTRFVHGEQGLAEAIKATQALAPGASAQLDSDALEAIAKDVPSCSLAYSAVVGASLVDVSVSAGLIQSKAAARRLIQQVSDSILGVTSIFYEFHQFERSMESSISV